MKANELRHEVSIERTIYLTGFMGSGKSTVGPALARVLRIPFVDLDEVIVARAGKPISEIFAEDGEDRFRALEYEALRSVGAAGYVVVSVGGGALVDSDNLFYARRTGVVVYLAASARTLAGRLAPAAAHRPMLQDAEGRPLTDDTLIARIERLLDKRSPFYEQAHLTVSTEERSVDDVVQEIAVALSTT